jgi:hypothetical protein
MRRLTSAATGFGQRRRVAGLVMIFRTTVNWVGRASSRAGQTPGFRGSRGRSPHRPFFQLNLRLIFYATTFRTFGGYCPKRRRAAALRDAAARTGRRHQREASRSAPALWRFLPFRQPCFFLLVAKNLRFGHDFLRYDLPNGRRVLPKAAEGRRTPRRWRVNRSPPPARSVPECASPLALRKAKRPATLSVTGL